MFRNNSKSSFLLYAIRIFRGVVLQRTYRLDFKSIHVSIDLLVQET